MPSSEAMMSGLVATDLRILPKLSFPPRLISSATTEKALNMGTTTAMTNDTAPVLLLSPHSETSTGSPKITKLERMMP